MSMEEIHDPAAREVAVRLAEAGHQVYIAGGAARDMVLGKDPEDYDLATDAPLHRIREIFADKSLRLAGRTFTVVLVNGVEVSAFRSKASFGPDAREGAVGGDILEDLSLRDLTVNSMAVDAATGELVDPYGGKADLEEGVVRFTGDPAERLGEDPCRAVRACRFLALIGGRFSPSTLAALKVHAPGSVIRTAPERLHLEIMKAMRIRRASAFFRSLLDVGALALIFPALAETAGHPGGPNHADDVFTHSMLAGDAIPARCPLLKLAAYIHDAGKPRAAEMIDGKLKFIGHEKHGAYALKPQLERLYFSRREQKEILAIIRHHMHDFTPGSTPRAARRLLARLANDGVAYASFLRFRIADRAANRAKKPYTFGQIKTMLGLIEQEVFPRAHGPAYTISDLAVGGFEVMRELDLVSGPEVGRMLGELLERVIENPELNEKKTLIRMIRENKLT
jgi:tRNA nucleotidyltransferase/poly(A) polymerase